MSGTFPELEILLVFILFFFSPLGLPSYAKVNYLPGILRDNCLSAVHYVVRMICRFVSSQFSFALFVGGYVNLTIVTRLRGW